MTPGVSILVVHYVSYEMDAKVSMVGLAGRLTLGS